MHKIRSSIIYFLLLTVVGVFLINMKPKATEDTAWIAPAEANKLVNPLNKDKNAWKEVEDSYNMLCAICHGEQGTGDGIAGMALNPRPANFSLDRVQNQTDGAIFWKLTNGKPPMAAYKEILTEDQRWQMVKLIRHLAEEK